jgi:hypothetical protein
MGSKLYKAEAQVLHYSVDFVANPQSAVGAVNLGELPEGFVVQSVTVKEESALTASATVKVGPTSDDDGFVVAIDIASQKRGEGVLVYEATDKRPLEHVVAASQDLILTTAVAAAVAGKLSVFVQGYQL